MVLIERDKHSRKGKDDSTSYEKVNHFRGVSFDDWLRVFMQVSISTFPELELRSMVCQYAFILSKRGDDEQAEEVLRHILMSNAYRSKETQVTIRLAIIST